MPVVEITIGKDLHQISCGDGEEKKLNKLALRFKEKIESLHQSFPSATDKTLYFMAGMMLMDEIEEPSSPANEETAQVIDDITEKVEGLIKKLETTCDVS